MFLKSFVIGSTLMKKVGRKLSCLAPIVGTCLSPSIIRQTLSLDWTPRSRMGEMLALSCDSWWFIQWFSFFLFAVFGQKRKDFPHKMISQCLAFFPAGEGWKDQKTGWQHAENTNMSQFQFAASHRWFNRRSAGRAANKKMKWHNLFRLLDNLCFQMGKILYTSGAFKICWAI